MKKILLISGAVLAILIVLIFVVLAWHGMFSKPKVQEKEMGPYCYAYQDFIGDYSKTMPIFDQVYTKLEKAGIKTTIGIGVYLDNPSVVPAEKLRSQCGSIISELDTSNTMVSQLKKGFIERKKFAVIEFPVKTSLSYMVGPMKCYPSFSEYFKSKGYKTSVGIEVYDMPNKVIYYLMPIE